MRSQKGSGERTWERLATQEVPMTNDDKSILRKERLKEKEGQEIKEFQGGRSADYQSVAVAWKCSSWSGSTPTCSDKVVRKPPGQHR